MYTGILALHVLATIATVGALGYALYSLHRKIETAYRKAALAIGSIAAFEVVSGTLLAVLSTTVTAAGLVIHIAAYLGFCLAVEALLFNRIRKTSVSFPVGAVTVPVLASLSFFVAALQSGL